MSKPCSEGSSLRPRRPRSSTASRKRLRRRTGWGQPSEPDQPGLVGNEPGQRLIADDHAAVGGGAVEREQDSVVDPAILELEQEAFEGGGLPVKAKRAVYGPAQARVFFP